MRWSVPIGDAGAMADRLEELLADTALRERLCAAGLQTAERYALARMAPLFGEALDRARLDVVKGRDPYE